ncbi:cytochrome P450 [Streptomyces luteolifulvus]|uniref:Cytochrome P450 n=1 Tax=Streptomyces luteolifulvus TaxID=2615112 RepID=A0A6H9UQT7_9ACTN|nr:cytochrome P450 [Streptomyces luteolifulvus]KAB1140277.1 cytochrome P450 [Streptomyces luteolifulvus]
MSVAGRPVAFPFDTHVVTEMFERLAWLRENEPAARVVVASGHEVWLVTRYEDVRLVLRDRRFSVPATTAPDAPRLFTTPFPPGVTLLRDTEPPDHARLRRLVMPEFRAQRVQRSLPLIRRVTDELLDALAEAGPPADLVTGFARPLPMAVICAWLGIPAGDGGRILALMDTMIGSNPVERIVAAQQEMCDYLAALTQARRAQPADDLFSTLVTAHDEQGSLSDAELTGLGISLLFAGHPVVTGVLAGALRTLLHRPADLARLRADPALAQSAVEELLRHQLVLRDGQIRMATEDVELAGVTVRAGESVVVSLNAANHDPAVFPDAERLDLGRDPNPHLAFGHGIHRCLASHLARAELRIGITSLLARFPGLRAAPRAPVGWRDHQRLQVLAALPVTW